MSLDFTGRVAIVTGAGDGLGLKHAVALAARDTRVVVNDFGGARDGIGGIGGIDGIDGIGGTGGAGGSSGIGGIRGLGGCSAAAQAVVDEIRAAGGQARAHGASVTDMATVQDMVDQTVAAWGRVDVLVNNAGVLRDKSFAKKSLEDFRFVLDVHLMGAVHCCKAVWPHMQAQQYACT